MTDFPLLCSVNWLLGIRIRISKPQLLLFSYVSNSDSEDSLTPLLEGYMYNLNVNNKFLITQLLFYIFDNSIAWVEVT